MTTRLEIFNYRDNAWSEFKKLVPGEHTTFSQNLPEGPRALYRAECAKDNLSTAITVSINPGDVTLSRTEKFVPNSAAFEEVTTLQDGEVYEVELRRNPNPAKIKITHIKD